MKRLPQQRLRICAAHVAESCNKPHCCRIAALVWRLLSDFEDDEPSKGEENRRNAQLELCFHTLLLPSSSSLWNQWKRCSCQQRLCSPETSSADLATTRMRTHASDLGARWSLFANESGERLPKQRPWSHTVWSRPSLRNQGQDVLKVKDDRSTHV